MDRRIESAVRSFITENLAYGDEGDQLADDASLLDAGLIDSTGVLELVAFLEKTFAIEVADTDIVPDNLDSIGAIGAYVRRTQAEARRVASETVGHAR